MENNEVLDLSQFKDQYSLDTVSKTVSFDVRRQDGLTGQLYTGTFKIKLFLNLKERSQAAASYSKRNLGIDKSDRVYALNKIICELQAACVECPPWFKDEAPFDIVDTEAIVDTIYVLHLAAGDEYVRNLQSR